MHFEPIFAPLTHFSAVPIGVVRVSGKNCWDLCQKFLIPTKPRKPGVFYLSKFVDPDSREIIDEGLVVFFKGPKSFTGEDVVELYPHGNSLILQKLSAVLNRLGIRLAEPGEFSKRAFLNGKLDLPQAEALADLISAKSEKHLQFARRNYFGEFSRQLTLIHEDLRDLLATLEATIDFAEEDLGDLHEKFFEESARRLKENLEKMVSGYDLTKKLYEGLQICFLGKVNAGKSSCFNLILGRERAIVSPEAGTTRDFIEAQLEIGGVLVKLVDLAGIRDTENMVEKKGIELALDIASQSDLILFVIAANEWFDQDELLSKLNSFKGHKWLVLTKIDLVSEDELELACRKLSNFFSDVLKICPLNADYRQPFLDKLTAFVESLNLDSSLSVYSDRQKELFKEAVKHLDRFLQNQNKTWDMRCEEIRLALRSVDQVLGKTYVEDLLGRIFSKFCIGK